MKRERPTGRITQEELIKKIGIPDYAAKMIEAFPLSDGEYEEYRSLFLKDSNAFLTAVRERKEYRLLFLKLYLRMAWEARELYDARGIPERIYYDTFQDIAVWMENCVRAYGEVGIEQYDWLWRHVKGRLFRLGRLQYEVVKGAEEPELNGKKLRQDEIVLNLHIPQGEPLDLEQCKESLREAAGFFENFSEITCHSWLLSPALRQLLPEESNIIKFQSLFSVYGIDRESREAEERIFGRLCENPLDYPENTSLGKAMKKYLLAGGKPGSAYGKCNWQA